MHKYSFYCVDKLDRERGCQMKRYDSLHKVELGDSRSVEFTGYLPFYLCSD